jgi:hypothetical protein
VQFAIPFPQKFSTQVHEAKFPSGKNGRTHHFFDKKKRLNRFPFSRKGGEQMKKLLG